MWLLFIFVAIPIIEIALFIQVGGFIGLWPTLAIVVLTAFIGTTLLRSQGIATLNNLQSSVGAGQNPMDHIAHGAMILIAGVVLLTPGFFTDAVGLALLIPGVRAMLIKAGAAKLAGNANIHVFQHGQKQQPDVYEADYTVVDEENQSRGDSGWTKGQIDKE
jgi:UPF0716 protein FxsA